MNTHEISYPIPEFDGQAGDNLVYDDATDNVHLLRPLSAAALCEIFARGVQLAQRGGSPETSVYIVSNPVSSAGAQTGDLVALTTNGFCGLVRSVGHNRAARELVRPSLSHESASSVDEPDDAGIVEAFLANPDTLPVTQEPRARWVLLDAHGEDAGRAAYDRLWRSRHRIQTRYNAELRARGKSCSSCDNRFQPKRITQIRCPSCIAAKKEGLR